MIGKKCNYRYIKKTITARQLLDSLRHTATQLQSVHKAFIETLQIADLLQTNKQKTATKIKQDPIKCGFTLRICTHLPF